MFATAIRQFSRRVVMPQLSPTHSASRIVSMKITEGDRIAPNHVVMILESSNDIVHEENRDPDKPQPLMIVESQDEGKVTKLIKDWQDKWLDVGTELAVLDDGDPINGDWTWQAYVYEDNNEKNKEKAKEDDIKTI